MPSSVHIPSCHSDQCTDLQCWSFLFTTLTANGKPLHINQVLSWMTIWTQKSLLPTFSAGPSCLKRYCRTWNVSFVSARPTSSHWTCVRAVSVPNILSSLVLMFVQSEITLPCQSINFLNTGLNRNLPGMLQKLSDLHNSTASLSLILSCELPHFANKSPNLTIPSLLHHIGRLPPKNLSTS